MSTFSSVHFCTVYLQCAFQINALYNQKGKYEQIWNFFEFVFTVAVLIKLVKRIGLPKIKNNIGIKTLVHNIADRFGLIFL